MKRNSLIIGLIFLFLSCTKVNAAEVSVTNSAQIKNQVDFNEYQKDFRVTRLRNFFSKYDSPLVEYSIYFVYFADMYQIDWRLLPAITGVESTFGKHMPYNSYNAYGWSQGNYRFESWTDSIEVVSRSLRDNYKSKGAVSISQIARRYCPPSTTWKGNVLYFMEKIDSTPLTFNI